MASFNSELLVLTRGYSAQIEVGTWSWGNESFGAVSPFTWALGDHGAVESTIGGLKPYVEAHPIFVCIYIYTYIYIYIYMFLCGYVWNVM